MTTCDQSPASVLCDECPYLLRIREDIEYRAQLGSARALNQKYREQLAEKDQVIAALKAKLRKREHQAFGRKSEKSRNRSESSSASRGATSKRPRGQQKGNSPPPRRKHSQIPERHVTAPVAEAERVCPTCGLPLEAFGDPEVTTSYEIEIIVHKVITSKERLRPVCGCGRLPGIVTAAALGPLFPGSQYGSTLWAEILAGRYLDGQPMGAVLRRLSGYGMDLPSGTVHSMVPRLCSLFEPLYQGACAYSRQEDQWHADETGMRVWLSGPDNAANSPRWWLWTFVAPETTVFLIDPRRSHAVPLEHLGEQANGTIIADRHSAYKKFARLAIHVLLAFCWAHARRDFLDTAREWPTLEDWCFAWKDRIGELYDLNNHRRQAPPDSLAFKRRHGKLNKAVDAFFTQVREEHADDSLHPEQTARMESLLNHEEGLRIFVDNPAVAMDNNTAERAIRPIVLARQLFYGCQSRSSAQLLAQLSTIFATLQQQHVDVRPWLKEYLAACALSGGQPPPNAETYLTKHLPKPSVQGDIHAA